MAMIFVVLAMVSMRGCLATKRQWDSTAVATVASVCEAFEARLEWYRTCLCGRFLRQCGLWQLHLDMSKEQQAIEWFLLRILFLREYGVQVYCMHTISTMQSSGGRHGAISNLKIGCGRCADKL
eukprot:SAG31_NODE_2412_length_5746_cov_5.160439_5_plen_124_part_00